MTVEIARLRALDVSNSMAKRSASKALMKAVTASNVDLMARKREARAAEVEEDRRIARYVRDRDARQQVSGTLYLLGLGRAHTNRFRADMR